MSCHLVPPRLRNRVALSCLHLIVALWAAALSADEPPSLPVFPEAAGFGTRTPAGRGGAILRVTNLEPDGPGSLHAALQTQGKRMVVFEIAGVIDIGKTTLIISEPFVTIAGQTAPKPGITIIGGGIRVTTHDVLIQHLRVRPGDKGGPGWPPDGISIGSQDDDVFNVVVDHCSFTWAIDENASVSGKRDSTRDITISNCIIAEGLSNATHPKGEHSKGTLIMDGIQNVALIGNLYAHNFRRNPYIKSGTSTVIANNLIYNPGQLGLHASRFGGSGVNTSVVGNVFRAGPDTPAGLSLLATMGDGITVYLKDNLAFDAAGKPIGVATKGGSGEVRKWNARLKQAPEPTVWCEELEPLPAADVTASVLANAGAFPEARDKHDARIVDSVREGTGSIIDSQKEVGGYPDYGPIRRALPPLKSPHADPDGNGYSTIEESLHRMARMVE